MSSEINVDDLASALHNLQIEQKSDELVLVKKNPEILSEMLKTLNCNTCSKWQTTDFTDKVFQLIELEECSSEYLKIKTIFECSMRRCFTVDKIERVENPYLLIQYNLKKIKKNCPERNLFHGTAQENVKLICRENFNWRMAGKSKGHRFGRGVSFSPDSTYSSHYPETYFLAQRTMIFANVLVKACCIGNPLMTVPDEPADTSIKEDGKVVVKYEDSDFYPEYAIYYS